MDTHRLSSLLRALADPTRLSIVSLLTRRDFCGCELVPLFGVSQPAVSQHLARLKSVGLVNESRHGQWVFYHLDQDLMAELSQALSQLRPLSESLSGQVGTPPANCPWPIASAR